MTNNNVTVNKELVNKLSNIIKGYNPYTAYIDDYQQYSNAVDINCKMDQQFIHTCKEYGYDVGVSFCYSLAKSLASGKFNSAEETAIYYINSLTKEDDSILSSPNEITENIDNANKEEIAMKKNTNNTVTNNSETVEKEEFTMRTTEQLINDALNISKIQDENYVTNAMLREEYNKLTGNVISSKKTRPVIIKAIQDVLNTPAEESPVEVEETVAPEVVSVGDLEITSDRIYHDDTIIEKPVKPAPDDAKVLTYRLMHKIGDHALSNRKKGFGTTVSAWMLCAYILKVKYGMTHLKGHEHEVTDEMKETVKDVRNWLLNNGYIKPVTFKDEKGFTFYTPEYDGNRKDKMYDCTKFRATGKVETTTYRVTEKMNKWYV